MKEPAEHIRTLTTKGQVTIPVEVRRFLGVKPHDRVVFRISNGRVEIRPPTMSLEETFGSVTPMNRPEDFKKLREIAVEEHVQKIIEEMQR